MQFRDEGKPVRYYVSPTAKDSVEEMIKIDLASGRITETEVARFRQWLLETESEMIKKYGSAY